MKKKIFLSLVATAIIASVSLAQETAQKPALDRHHPKEMKSDEDRIKEMKEDLNLTDAQVSKIKAIHKAHPKPRKPFNELSEDEKTFYREERKLVRQEIRKVLTPEQRKKFDAHKKVKMHEHKRARAPQRQLKSAE